MANGDSPVADPFVLRSGVRSGLKRELAFALQSQSLLPSSLSRTRSGKSPNHAYPLPLPLPFPLGSDCKRPKNDSVAIPIQEEEELESEKGGSDCSEKPARVFARWYSRGKGLTNNSSSDGIALVTQVDAPVHAVDGVGVSETDVAENNVEQSSCAMEEEKLLLPTVDTHVDSELESGVIEKPTRRFTRSSLNATPEIKDKDKGSMVNGHDSSANEGDEIKQPTRRFTRSTLKSSACDSGVRDGATTSSESNESEEVKGHTKCGYGTVTSDLKMFKKIALKKIPGNARELLSTGLLEGLPVKYITNTKPNGLEGVIKGSGILCSCPSCNGCTVVSAYVFEQHAGSTKKHPSDFIFLKNGNSLRDVVRACSRNSLDMLETTIRNAVGAAPSKNITCQKCKGPLPTEQTGMFALFCDSCLESKQSLKSPSSIPSYGVTCTPRTNVGPASDWPDNRTLSSKKKSSAGRLTRKDLGLHKLVFVSGILPEGTEVGYYVRGKRLLEGYIRDSGIFCRCCDTVVSPSQFESHAGQASRRKPYNYIYTSNGVSLHELSVSLSKDRKLLASENDDLCSICADYGDLLLCDLCPRAFHRECVGLSSIPSGKWQCQHCLNLQRRERSVACNDNAIAAGRVEGVDPIEQIYKQCIRIVSITDVDDSSCALCERHEFSKSGFGDSTVIICDQCGKEYHVKCLRDHKMADLKEVPEGEWFCSTDCNKVWKFLLEILVHGRKPIPDVDAKLIERKCEGREGISINISDLSWRLLSGSTDSEDSNLLLSSAVKIIRESFTPIVDRSGRDLIPFMVYGQMARDQDYGGTYCAVLTEGSSVVCAATLRVMGSQVAELPLVATSREYQGLGLFQALFSCVGRLLASLKVKHLVLPAAEEAKSIWTNKFGFTKLTSDQLKEYLKGARPTVFQGTSVLYKPVSVP